MQKKFLLLTRDYLSGIFLSFSVFAVLWAGAAFADPQERYPLMHLSGAQRSAATIRSLTQPRIRASEVIPPGNVNLLNLVPYIPEERDQGHCGNCWVWAATGMVEVALNTQLGISERLSIQYLNSNFNWGGTIAPQYPVAGSFACEGGLLETFVNFYNGDEGAKRFIPWSNTNAGYADGDGGQSGGYSGGNRTNMPAVRIAMTPAVGISSITGELIETEGVGEEAAINNIKSVIGNNQAIFFGFTLPDDASWNDFFDFWDYATADTIFDLNPYGLLPWSSDAPGAHAVMLVGYNDLSPDPEQHYWLLLNSWATRPNRPDGTFKIKMHMDYDSKDIAHDELNYWAEKVTVNFVTPTPTPTPTPTQTPEPTATPTTTTVSGQVTDTQGNPMRGVIVSAGTLGMVRTNERGEYLFNNVQTGLRFALKFFKTGVAFEPAEVSGIASVPSQTIQVSGTQSKVRRAGCAQKDTSGMILRTVNHVRNLNRIGEQAIHRLRALTELKSSHGRRREILAKAAQAENRLGTAYRQSLAAAERLPSSISRCAPPLTCREHDYSRKISSLRNSISKMRNAARAAASEMGQASAAGQERGYVLGEEAELQYRLALRAVGVFPQGGCQ